MAFVFHDLDVPQESVPAPTSHLTLAHHLWIAHKIAWMIWDPQPCIAQNFFGGHRMMASDCFRSITPWNDICACAYVYVYVQVYVFATMYMCIHLCVWVSEGKWTGSRHNFMIFQTDECSFHRHVTEKQRTSVKEQSRICWRLQDSPKYQHIHD